MNRTLAQVARLTRSILLQPDTSSDRPSAQFIAGKHPPSGFPSGIGIHWWYGSDTLQAQEALASLLKETESSFKDCDTESVVKTISTTLQEICLDRPLFNGDDVFLRRQPNLFECRGQIPVVEFASRILDAIKSNLRGIIGRRCTLYPLPRYRGPSFVVPGAGVRAVAKTDELAWTEFGQEGYELGGWSPQSPTLTHNGGRFPGRSDFEYMLVSEEYGTQSGAKFASSIKFRVLITIVHAVSVARSRHPIHKAMAQPFTSCIQFPHRTAPDHVITASNCHALSPYYISDINLEADDVKEVLSWYRERLACSSEFRQRLDKATHFVNRGMNADDIEAYINHFVALDALFGERGSVEASVLSGIQALGLGPDMEQKVPWLFDLRNELVHGGSRYIAEWPKYQRYVRHFKTKPLDDIGQLARSAILRAPSRLSP